MSADGTQANFSDREPIQLELLESGWSASLIQASLKHGLGFTAYELGGVLQEPAIDPFLAWSILPGNCTFESFKRTTMTMVHRYCNGTLVKLSDFERIVKGVKGD